MTSKQATTANSPITRRLSAVRRAEDCATAREFAAVLDISTNRYSDIEAGSDLSIEIAQLIVGKVPGCSLDWLYNGIEDGLSVSLHRRLMV